MLDEKLHRAKKTNMPSDKSALQSFAQETVASVEELLFSRPCNDFRDTLERRLKFRITGAIEKLRGKEGISPYGVVVLYDEAYGIIPKFLDKAEELTESKKKHREKIIRGFGMTMVISAVTVTIGLTIAQYLGNYYIHPLAGAAIVSISSIAAGHVYNFAASGLRASPITFGLPKQEREKYNQFRQSAITSLIETYHKSSHA